MLINLTSIKIRTICLTLHKTVVIFINALYALHNLDLTRAEIYHISKYHGTDKAYDKLIIVPTWINIDTR